MATNEVSSCRREPRYPLPLTPRSVGKTSAKVGLSLFPARSSARLPGRPLDIKSRLRREWKQSKTAALVFQTMLYVVSPSCTKSFHFVLDCSEGVARNSRINKRAYEDYQSVQNADASDTGDFFGHSSSEGASLVSCVSKNSRPLPA